MMDEIHPLFIHNVVKKTPKRFLEIFLKTRSHSSCINEDSSSHIIFNLCYIILGTILHHNCVIIFSCFHNKILFELMFCTFCVLVLIFVFHIWT
jgi:hypothetical protein